MTGMDAVQAAKVGAQVRRARKSNDWTQDELAHEAGVAPGTVNRIENGRGVRPGNLRAVLDALSIRPVMETERTPDENVKLALEIIEAALMATPVESRDEATRDLIRYVSFRQTTGL